MTASRRYLSIGVAVLVIGGLGVYVYLHNRPLAEGPGYTVELVDPVQPSLDRALTITADLPEQSKADLRANFEQLKKGLQAEPTRVDLWLSLGLCYKTAGDYEGAAEVWQYVADAAPDGLRYIALGNLGDLYANFIKDYPKAESYYLQALAVKPTEIGYYRNLYTLYRYLYKTDTSAAADILKEGLAKNPGNSELLALQQELQAGN
jgi:tetratricopeptide (TPR) repeat protein